MKILLVRPFHNVTECAPPLALVQLAGYLLREGIEVEIIDALRERISHEQLTERIVAARPDAVGITCLTAWFYDTVQVSRLLKARGQRVIIGGFHPSFLPYTTLKESGCDLVVCGEGERALLSLCQSDFDPSGIAGVYAQGSLDAEPARITYAEGVKNMDDLPFPAWSLMDPRQYTNPASSLFSAPGPLGLITTSRGCPYSCSFCATPNFYNKRIRYRSPDSVIAEIKFLRKEFGIRGVQFWDDNLTMDRKHAMGLFQALVDQKVNIKWTTPAGLRADRMDEELLRLAKRSGCIGTAMGIESGSPEMLKKMRKGETLDTIRKAISTARRVGIPVMGYFILGQPGENMETMKQTIDFACSSELSAAMFFLFDVLPGSEYWGKLQGQFTPDWKKRSYRDSEWLPEGVTYPQLRALQKEAYRRFYMRPRTVRLLWRNFTPTRVYRIFREARKWLAS
jgi:radical SAM superfamily enzyme YgiQ (UPF0313 family)